MFYTPRNFFIATFDTSKKLIRRDLLIRNSGIHSQQVRSDLITRKINYMTTIFNSYYFLGKNFSSSFNLGIYFYLFRWKFVATLNFFFLLLKIFLYLFKILHIKIATICIILANFWNQSTIMSSREFNCNV
jgi:hypothetical protein